MDNDDDDEINLENIFKKQKELKTAYEEGESKAQQVKLRKSPNDLRNYRELKLSNEMKVLLIQDPNVTEASVCLDFMSGWCEDPHMQEGLAQFTQRLLLYENDSYTELDSCRRFIIEKHGGKFQATCGFQHATYSFQINPKFLAGALDRFGAMFVVPHYLELPDDFVEEQRKEQDEYNECRKSYEDERFWHLMRMTIDEAHSYHQLANGNGQTVQRNSLPLKQCAFQHHSNQYTANLMTLVILTNHKVEIQETWAKSIFQAIDNKTLDPPSLEHFYPFTNKEQGIFFRMKPLKPDINRVIFLWPIFNFKNNIKQCHIQYLIYMFNQDSEGSIISQLRKHGWCLQLLADVNEEIYEIPQFRIQVLLTDNGMKFVIRIQEMILSYINLIKEKGKERSAYELFLTQNTMIFESTFMQQQAQLVKDIAHHLHYNSGEQLVYTNYSTESYDMEILREMLSHLKPENMRITLVSQQGGFIFNKVEEFYKISYHKKVWQKKTIQLLNNVEPVPGFQLPQNKIYYPVGVRSVINFPYPIGIDISPQVRLWYHQNFEFKDDPKSYLIGYIYMDDEQFTREPKTDILLSLYQMVFREHYPEIKNSFKTGIGFGFSNNFISLAFVGESREMVSAFHEFFIHLRTFNEKAWEHKDNFENFKKELTFKYSEFYKQPPLSQSCYIKLAIMQDHGHFDMRTLENLIKDITFEEFSHFVGKILKRTWQEWILCGDINYNMAEIMMRHIEVEMKKLHKDQQVLPIAEIPSIKILKLPDKTSLIFQKDMQSIHGQPIKLSTIDMTYFYGYSTSQQRLIAAILTRFMDEVSHETLKAEDIFNNERLKIYNQVIRHVLYFTIKLRSFDQSPMFQSVRLQEFLLMIKKELKKMDDKTFNRLLGIVRKNATKRPQNQKEKVEFFCSKIKDRSYEFEQIKEAGALCDDIVKEDILDMFNDIFIDNVRRLEIHMVSPLHKKEQEAFKKAVAKELAQTKEFKLHGFFKIPELKDAQVYFKDFMSLQ